MRYFRYSRVGGSTNCEAIYNGHLGAKPDREIEQVTPTTLIYFTLTPFITSHPRSIH